MDIMIETKQKRMICYAKGRGGETMRLKKKNDKKDQKQANEKGQKRGN